MSRFLYIEPFAGASGDMLLGSLIGLGVPLSLFENAVASLGLEGCRVECNKVSEKGLDAHRVSVHCPDSTTHRNLPTVLKLLDSAHFPAEVRRLTDPVFKRLAKAESQVHGIPLEEVHFHEVGALDSIIDIVCFALGWNWLKVEGGFCAPFPIGGGTIECLHGRLPNPSPATLNLIKGWPARSVECDTELLTPTGAAVLTTHTRPGRPAGTFTFERTSLGAGHKELPFANVVRASLGRTSLSPGWENLTVVECHIDDCSPEVLSFLMERLLEAGALDVSLEPVYMKKGRLGQRLWALAHPHEKQKLASIILSESTSLGVRSYEVERWALPRRISTVTIKPGNIRVKEATDPEGRIRFTPEFEDARTLSRESGIPLLKIYEMAVEAAYRRLQSDEFTGGLAESLPGPSLSDSSGLDEY